MSATVRQADGRYGCQSSADARAPVPVTCYGCRCTVPPSEPIWVNRDRVVFIFGDRVTKPLPVGPWCAQREGAAEPRPWNNAGRWRRGGWIQNPPRTCRNCGRLFHAIASRYCTDRCANIARAGRRQAREAARHRCCERCGHLFTAPRSDTQYCSPACRQAAYRQRCAEKAAVAANARAILSGYEQQLLGGAA